MLESKPSAPDIPTPDQRYQPLSDSLSQVESPRYRCPVASCHQTWYRSVASAEIPHCPIHNLQLVRDSKVR
jgi:hypothetical protein